MASLDTLKIIAPGVASLSDPLLEQFIEWAADQMDAVRWGALYQQGAIRLAAHMATLYQREADGDGGVGPVVERKAGKLSVRYGAVVAVTDDDAVLATTTHGLEYLRLRRQLGPGAMVV